MITSLTPRRCSSSVCRLKNARASDSNRSVLRSSFVRLYISTYATPVCAARANISSDPPDTSLIIATPYSSTARRATAGRNVSTDSGTDIPVCRATRSAILSRAHSCCSSASSPVLACTAGRVEQAPISMMSAPSLTALRRAERTAASSPARLAAKKLSGVALMIAITRGVLAAINRPPKRID